MIEIKAAALPRWLGSPPKLGEVAVPSQTFAVIAAVVAAFGGFAVVLAWADYYATPKR